MNRAFSLLLLLSMFAFNAWADDLDALQGKWTVKKTNERGSFTQQIEFTKSKWFFKITNADGAVSFTASGDVEIKKQGPFKTARFFSIKAGRSETDMEAVDDERNSIFMVDAGVLYLAGNFDKARDNEKPSVDAYSKVN
jgi:hypothetical protein